ncbi:M61 family metallopeptidase [Sediminicola luteus]|uniref:Peptidase M61 n=1 Tax=Sediminicola luteus TaxID=319238 RepID=A0A2A4G2Z0_9FLAO|nr:PDZ domain-containing protein [Sediminicola luteus]PCE62783.1 peptidase M61 [Sediminicola luteus]
MKRFFTLSLIVFFGVLGMAQTNSYRISFENAQHHEGQVEISFPEVKAPIFSVRMPNSSPGRYAFHSFAKNVYGFKATDGKGNPVTVFRPNPYQWDISGHDGTVNISYTLFANRADGTYSQIDETHAHLNMPASFMYAPDHKERPIEIEFDLREDLGWKVATQLKRQKGNTYWAPNFYYFMDSPTEISNHSVRSFTLPSNGKDHEIRFALHHEGTETEFDQFFENVKKIVIEQEKVFGELPDFDFGSYTFLGCYMPHVNGDGMEHRNSTIVTSKRSLADGGITRNLGTVSHEFFHAWNVERLRPLSLEPFDFDHVDMSGELWFAEGFTSYYTNLIICRAGIMEPEEFVGTFDGTFNYVWNSNGRKFSNPIEMSYQAPFVDAATSLDPQNRGNTFISYYSYGAALGLALDLSLREKNLNLDDFFKKLWGQYGKKEIPYTIENLHHALNAYAGNEFGTAFFEKYIYRSGMPDYKRLFASVGIALEQNSERAYFGGYIEGNAITDNTLIDRPAYNAGLAKGDRILAVDGQPMDDENTFEKLLGSKKPGDVLQLKFERHGKTRETQLELGKNPTYSISMDPDATAAQITHRKAWLGVE